MAQILAKILSPDPMSKKDVGQPVRKEDKKSVRAVIESAGFAVSERKENVALHVFIADAHRVSTDFLDYVNKIARKYMYTPHLTMLVVCSGELEKEDMKTLDSTVRVHKLEEMSEMVNHLTARKEMLTQDDPRAKWRKGLCVIAGLRAP